MLIISIATVIIIIIIIIIIITITIITISIITVFVKSAWPIFSIRQLFHAILVQMTSDVKFLHMFFIFTFSLFKIFNELKLLGL